MDENYLDNLLGQVSPDKKQNNDFENTVDADADIDIDLSDLTDISLGEMDGLDDVDLSDLELDDIDFDDMDVTSLDTAGVAKTEQQQEEDEDFNLDSLLDGISAEDIGQDVLQEDVLFSEAEGDLSQPAEDVFTDAEQQLEADISFPEVMSEEEIMGLGSLQTAPEEETPSEDTGGEQISDDDSGVEDMDLDALFSALGIEEEEGIREDDYLAGEGELEAQLQSSMEMIAESGELDDIADISEVKPEGKVKKRKKKAGGKKAGAPREPKEKKSLSEIIFGKPDEDDIEEERILAEKKAEKQVKKEQQKEEKETKKAEKQETLEIKKKADEKKRQIKENKKKEKQAALEAELAEEADEKKVSTLTVVIVFVMFAALCVLVIFGTKTFHYTRVIQKAEDYFERQRYRLAYDEVSGVEIKKKDADLSDKIYTVMYVERLYESYENNILLNRPDKALDALLRGLEKYDEHYDEAVQLDIVEDIDACRSKIMTALLVTYGISETQAYEIMQLEGAAYTQMLTEYSEGLLTGE